MNTKHTPGPWEATGNVVHRGIQTVALVYSTPREQCEADARLIAAAPDLLAALKELLAAERFSNRPPETVMEAELKLDRIRAAGIQAQAAIAKATGEL
jgi:hypothetical protein